MHSQTFASKVLVDWQPKGIIFQCEDLQPNCPQAIVTPRWKQCIYQSQERGKHRQYKEHIRKVEMSSFTPPPPPSPHLVLSIFEEMSKCTAVHQDSRLDPEGERLQNATPASACFDHLHPIKDSCLVWEG